MIRLKAMRLIFVHMEGVLQRIPKQMLAHGAKSNCVTPHLSLANGAESTSAGPTSWVELLVSKDIPHERAVAIASQLESAGFYFANRLTLLSCTREELAKAGLALGIVVLIQ